MSENNKRCWNPGCQEEGMKCILPWPKDEDDFERYCPDHAFENGYCYGCGLFQAGIETFDFGPYKGLCDNCEAEARSCDYDECDEEMDFPWLEHGPYL